MKNNKMLIVALIGLIFGLPFQVQAKLMKPYDVTVELDFMNRSGEMVYLSIENARGGSLLNEEALKNGKHFHARYEGAFADFKSLKIKLMDENKLDKKVFSVKTEGKSTCYLTYGKQNGKLTLYHQTVKHSKSMGKKDQGNTDRATNVSDADIMEQEL